MISVAWQVPNSPNWIGGLNYFRNLLEALYALPDRKINPVLLGYDPSLPAPFDQCPHLHYPGGKNGFSGKVIRRLLKLEARFFNNGGTLARHLKHNNIKLLSHGQVLGKNSPVPAMSWIPDFQHFHLPNFFSDAEKEKREHTYSHIAHNGQALVFSSEDARKDFNTFFPHQQIPTYVLHFVAPVSNINLPPAEEILYKYEIKEPFFHIPNQLWAHKNHGIVAKALAVLQKQNKCPLIISTGQTVDSRDPHYFPQLKETVENMGLAERFRFLGLIPYADMQVLMRQSIAMINPSLFEGWSSTVEESKSLGKRIILSDIPVHQEQNPQRGIYFAPHDSEMLAEKLLTVQKGYDLEEEEKARVEAIHNLPQRLMQFAQTYENIVLDVISK